MDWQHTSKISRKYTEPEWKYCKNSFRGATFSSHTV